MPVIRDLVTRWGFDADKDKVDEFENSFSSLVGVAKISAAVFAASGAAVVGLVASAAPLQTALRNTMTMTNATGEAFNKLEGEMRTAAISMSEQLGISAEEMAGGFYQVLSTGTAAGTAGFYALSDTAAKLSKVVGMNFGQTVESLSDSVQALGLDMKDVDRVADQFFTTSKLGATTVPLITEAMKNAAPVARDAGVALDELSSYIVALANKGVKGSEAGVALRNIMLKLAIPTGKTKTLMNKLGIETKDSAGKVRNFTDILGELKSKLDAATQSERGLMLVQLVGQENVAKLSALLGVETDKLRSWQEQLKSSSGVLNAAFKKQLETFDSQFGLLKITLRNLAESIGVHLLPVVTPLIKLLKEAVKWTREWFEENPKVAQSIALIVFAIAALSGALLVVIPAILAFKGLAIVLGLVKISLAAFIASFLVIGSLIGVVVIAMSDFIGAMQGKASLMDKLIEKYPQYKSVIIAAGIAIMALSTILLAMISPLGLLIALGTVLFLSWKDQWGELKELISTFPDDISAIATQIKNDIGDAFSWVLEKGKSLFKWLGSFGIGGQMGTVGVGMMNAPIPVTGGNNSTANNTRVSGNTLNVNVDGAGKSAPEIVDAVKSGTIGGWEEMTRATLKGVGG